MYVESQDLHRIVVRTAKDLTFHYQVNGVRKSFKGFEAIADQEGEFMPATSTTMPTALPEDSKRRLIANGTYNEDGTLNLETAKRLGWTEILAKRGYPEEE